MIKTIKIDGLAQPIILARRRGTRSLRLSIKNDGHVRLSVPYGVPQFMAVRFALDRKEWIEKHYKPANILSDGMHIGKNHQLTIQTTASTRHSTRVTDTEIMVKLPTAMTPNSPEAQKITKLACERALLKEASKLLPQRLRRLSDKNVIKFRSCTIKKLQSRWGACDKQNNITLNSYLIQLDWRLIDYVICHELAHTQHHHHQKGFWDFVASIYPDYKTARVEIKSKPTNIIATIF